MSSLLETKGAPRDLGAMQGLALRAEIQKNVAAYRQAERAQQSLVKKLLGSGTESNEQAVARDLSRFFPHHAERLEGIARGAAVPVADLLAMLAAEFGSAVSGVAPATLGLHFGVMKEANSHSKPSVAASPLLWKTVETGLRMRHRLIARRTLPDNGYASLELTLPEHVLSLAGVNECGLAMLVSTPFTMRSALEPVAAPASLLGQDCLLRFDAAAKAVDWCMTRPAGGCADLLFADATGSMLGISIRGKERELMLPFNGILVAMSQDARSLAVRERIQHQKELTRESLFSLLQEHPADEREDMREDVPLPLCRHGAWLQTSAVMSVDPCTRSLSWADQALCAARLETFYRITF